MCFRILRRPNPLCQASPLSLPFRCHPDSLDRIRGRGKEALTTTALAGIHATAAAVAHSFRLHNAGGGGANSNETDSPSAAAPSFAPGSPLRALTLMDCPSLPPLAILEALSIVLTSDFGAANTQSGSRNAGGATWSGGKFGLAHVALGYSTAIPLTTAASPSSSSLSVAAVPSTCASAAHSRRCRLTAASIANGTGASRGGDETPSAAWVGSEEEDGGAGGLGGSLDEGMVRLASESLESVTVVGEVQLSALVLSRCWRLRRLELLQCRRLWRDEKHAAVIYGFPLNYLFFFPVVAQARGSTVGLPLLATCCHCKCGGRRSRTRFVCALVLMSGVPSYQYSTPHPERLWLCFRFFLCPLSPSLHYSTQHRERRCNLGACCC